MKTKRILAVVFATSLLLSGTACDKDDSQSSSQTQVTATQTTTTQPEISQEIIEERDVFEFSQEIHSGSINDTISWKIDEYGLLVISGSGDLPDYSAQTEQPWYEYCEDIKYLHIENGITSIGNAVFCGCVNLAEIKNDAQITNIGNYAFQNCQSLTEISIGDSLEQIGISAFENCYSLESAQLGANIIAIGKCAFKDCVALSSALDLSGVIRIEDYVFSGCKLMQFNEISADTEYIGRGSFEECEGLEAITIPERITSISESAFAGAGLQTLEIPSHVTDIGIASFTGCKELESISFGEGLISIGMGAFSGCDKLNIVNLPASVEFIDSNAFARCSMLTEIQISDDNQNYTCIDGVLYTKSQRTLKQYPSGRQNTEFEILSSVTDIEPGALQGAFNLEGVTVQSGNWTYTALDGVLYTAYYDEIVFYPPQKQAQEFIAPEGVTHVGIYAFYKCENLNSAVFGNSLTHINGCAFMDCTNLEQITVPQTMTEIGKNAFDNTKLSGEFSFNEGFKYYQSSFTENCTVNIIPNAIESE